MLNELNNNKKTYKLYLILAYTKFIFLFAYAVLPIRSSCNCWLFFVFVSNKGFRKAYTKRKAGADWELKETKHTKIKKKQTNSTTRQTKLTAILLNLNNKMHIVFVFFCSGLFNFPACSDACDFVQWDFMSWFPSFPFAHDFSILITLVYHLNVVGTIYEQASSANKLKMETILLGQTSWNSITDACQ